MSTSSSGLAPKWLVCLLILGAAVGASAFRLPRLDLRPMHGDEANQAYKTGILLDTGVYKYDPVEHHGPTLYYLTLPIAWARGQISFADTDETTNRLVPAIAGILTLLLILLVVDGLNAWSAVYAAVLMAVSPALTFYSRYYIQESLLVFFSFGLIACGWRYVNSRKLGWAIGAGLFAGFMFATKETCVLAFVAMAIGLAVCVFANRAQAKDTPVTANVSFRRHLAASLLSACLVSALFYSSFITHPTGVLDSFRAFTGYVHKANAAPLHDKPWHYYLALLLYTKRAPGPWWSEGLILGMAVVGVVVSFVKSIECAPLGKFLSIYTIALTAFYSLIHYKTPWCAVNFVQPMTLLAGIGACGLIRLLRYRVLQVVVIVLLAAGTTQLGKQDYRANFVYPADVRNPYVYAHTSSAAMRMVDRVNDIARISPDKNNMLVRIICPDGDYWPLPWYFRSYSHVGFWTSIPTDADAPMILIPASMQASLDPILKAHYQTEVAALRPGVLWFVYTRSDLWDAMMATRQ